MGEKKSFQGLIPKEAVIQKAPRKLVGVSIFKINIPQSRCRYTQESVDNKTNISLNHKKVPPTSQQFIEALPIKWIVRDSDTSDVVLVDIEKTDTNAIIINGFLPNHLTIMINGKKVEPDQNNGAIYAKVLKPKNNPEVEIEMVLIRK